MNKSVFLPPHLQTKLKNRGYALSVPPQVADEINSLWSERNRCDESKIAEIDNRMESLIMENDAR
jgi:hypothetical protein